MSARIVFPRRNGVAGLWLSKPGVDALTATAESDFLVLPNYKNEQIIHRGSFGLSNGGAERIEYFPEALSHIPVVAFWESAYGDRIQVPLRVHALTNIRCWVNASSALFKNNGASAMWIYYIVIARTAAFA